MSDVPMFDHMSLRVSNFQRAKTFYSAALKPLGISLVMEFPSDNGNAAGFGRGMPTFWIGDGTEQPQRSHVAFSAATRQAVDAFYRAAITAGATDNGAPGVRPHYHAHYYAAYVIDPDGHNIEAVIHTPPAAAKKTAKPAGKTAKAAAKGKTAKGKAAKAKPAAKARKAPARAAARKPARRGASKRTRR